MALTSVGYAGEVTPANWADLTESFGDAYGVLGAGSWQVSSVAGLDRTVSVAVGKGHGRGILDETDAATQIQLAVVASGTRWDTIVARRDWSSGTTTLMAVQGTSTRAISASRLVGPGETDDQPLALVQVTAGQQLPTAVVDLRCWAGNGGMFAASVEALGYLDAPGSHVRVGGDDWHAQVSTGGTVSWVLDGGESVGVFAHVGSLSGTPPAGAQFLMQTGSVVKVTGSDGLARLTFPTAFPAGLLSVFLYNGDASQGDLNIQAAGGSWGGGRRNDVVYQVTAAASGARLANKTHRVNFLAFGW